ncbi:MAG: hypothetical protein SGI96_02225 [Bacteroidota bacterium]|nr:hypothetical protein [Bacteroidota bacterium]
MVEEIIIKYINPALNLGMEDVRNVWLLSVNPVKLTTTIHQGNLIFRFPVSGKRISYKTLKRGLIKRQFILRRSYELLPIFNITTPPSQKSPASFLSVS